MTRRAWVLMALGGGAIVAAAYRLRGEEDIRPKLSMEQCREIGAAFLGVGSGDLTRTGSGMLLERPSRRRPPVYVYVLPYDEGVEVEGWAREQGRACVVVDAWYGEATAAEYHARRYEIGSKRLSEEQAKAAAQAFVSKHWQHYQAARFGSASEPWRPGEFSKPQTAPEQSFSWVVEEGTIRVGGVTVKVNLTTGKVVMYGQRYYPCDGLPAPRLTREQAINQALARLEAAQRQQARVEEVYLATRWYDGRIRLAWSVRLKAPALMPASFRGTPPMRTHHLELDAHTGTVYMEVR